MAFKTILKNDLSSVFLRPSEFADEIFWDGNSVTAVVDIEKGPEISARGCATNAVVHFSKPITFAPKIGDIVQYLGLAWVVDTLAVQDNLCYVATMHADEGMILK